MKTIIARSPAVLLCLALPSVVAAAAPDETRSIATRAEELAKSIAEGTSEPAQQKARQLLEAAVDKAWPTHELAIFALADTLSRKGQDAISAGQYDRAELLHIQDVEIRQACVRCADVGTRELKAIEYGLLMALQRVGDLYRELCRYAEAERHLERAQKLDEKRDAPSLPLLYCRAKVFHEQGRLSDAQPVYEKGLVTAEGLPAGDPERPFCIYKFRLMLGVCYYDLALRGQDPGGKDFWLEADTQFGEALSAFRGQLPDPPTRAEFLRYRARLYHVWCRRVPAGPGVPADRLDKAEKWFREALDILKQDSAGQRPDIIDTLTKLSAMHYDAYALENSNERVKADHLKAADAYLQEAFGCLSDASSIDLRFNAHYARAAVAAAKEQYGQALDDCSEAMRLALEQRASASGSSFDRGRYYTQLMSAAEQMVAWRTELAAKAQGDMRKDHIAAAFRAMELTRALALEDQVALRDKDLFQGMKANEAQNLKDDLRDARDKVLKADIELRNAARNRQPKREFENLVQAKRELGDVERQVWNTSPAVGQQMAKPASVATFDQLQAWATQTGSLVLEYFIGQEGSYVLAIRPGDGPLLEKLTWDREMPTAVWLRLGDLKGLSQVHADIQEAGALLEKARSAREKQEAEKKDAQAQDQFQKWRKESDEMHGWLADLYRQLIPASVRVDLAQGHSAWRQIVVLPDGPLARLPFETLVTDSKGPQRTYLLDADLPIMYSPSGTMLAELAKRPTAAPVRVGTHVCFVGKSNFTDHIGNWVPMGDGVFGGLPQLPQAANAGPGTFPGILKVAGLNVDVRNQNAATDEKAVVGAVQRVQIALFSTHGLGGDETISSFGALILTRPNPVNTLDDDGVLTYEEICECDLRGCELAIHTACDTNVGPNQRGETAWAVSRGFLVAGSCRVLATQWNAEDNASGLFTAELASQLASQLKDPQNPNLGQLDYVGAVHKARLQLRKHGIFGETPLLWAPWVLIGSK